MVVVPLALALSALIGERIDTLQGPNLDTYVLAALRHEPNSSSEVLPENRVMQDELKTASLGSSGLDVYPENPLTTLFPVSIAKSAQAWREIDQPRRWKLSSKLHEGSLKDDLSETVVVGAYQLREPRERGDFADGFYLNLGGSFFRSGELKPFEYVEIELVDPIKGSFLSRLSDQGFQTSYVVDEFNEKVLWNKDFVGVKGIALEPTAHKVNILVFPATIEAGTESQEVPLEPDFALNVGWELVEVKLRFALLSNRELVVEPHRGIALEEKRT